jgi:hypothetical protein
MRLNVSAPICIDELKKYFVDKSIFYVINYKESKIKGKKLLTYLSNLEIPSDVDFTGCSDEEFFEILKDYFETEMICNIDFLEKAAISIMKERCELSNTNFFNKFIDENSEIIDQWITKIHSLSLYNMYSINEFKDFVKTYELDDTSSLVGANFVSVLKQKDLYDIFQKIDGSKLKFYKKYFEDYMFKGKNIHEYWANENNPMFLLTFGIAGGLIKGNEYVDCTEKTIQELKNVAPV